MCTLVSAYLCGDDAAGLLCWGRIHYLEGTVTLLHHLDVALPAGGGAIGFFCASEGGPIASTINQADCPDFAAVLSGADCSHGAQSCMLRVTVENAAKKLISRNLLPLAKPSELRLPKATVTHTVTTAPAGSKSIQLTLSSDATAVYVWLSTAEHGRFSDNAFVLLPGNSTQVTFESFVEAGTSSAALSKSLRVEHLQMYM